MIDSSSGDFKLGLEDTEERFSIQQNLQEHRIEKLGTRVTIITFLIPILIGVIFTIAYLDIKKRIYRMHDTGIAELKKLSTDLESKFSALSVRYAKLEDSFSKRETELKKLEAFYSKKVAPIEEVFLSIEKSLSGLKNDIESLNSKQLNLENSINGLQSSKADIKIIHENMDDINEMFDGVYKDFRDLVSQMESLDQTLKGEMLTLTGFFGKEKKKTVDLGEAINTIADEISKLKTEMAKLNTAVRTASSKQVNQQDVKLALERAKMDLTVTVQEIQRSFSKDLQNIEKRLIIIETDLANRSSTGDIQEQDISQ
jgi:predicted  nucleic acid-binding Zn-ribbon protein